MAKQDSAKPEFWDVRFRERRTPWDAGRTPPELEAYLARHPGGGRVLIPGCGSGYEVRTFADRGYEVVAIDFAAAAIEKAAAELGPLKDVLVQGDFFSHDFGRPFDIVYERAFLAALPPRLWTDWAARMAELLRPQGRLVGFFVYGDAPSGPPFMLKPGALEALLAGKFERIEDKAVSASLPVFEGKERWEAWARRPV